MSCREWSSVPESTSLSEDRRLRTRLDFDQAFGTAINRFCCQAVIEHPLTPYGDGGQVRGFLPLRDSMQCLTLGLENPPDEGEYRVFNQFEETYSVRGLADTVQQAALTLGLKVPVSPVENPRAAIERQQHYFAPDHDRLRQLGYQPTRDVASEVGEMLEDLLPHRDRIAQHQQALLPDVHWDGRRHQVGYLAEEARDRLAPRRRRAAGTERRCSRDVSAQISGAIGQFSVAEKTTSEQCERRCPTCDSDCMRRTRHSMRATAVVGPPL